MTAIMDFAFQLFCLLTLEPPAVILACEYSHLSSLLAGGCIRREVSIISSNKIEW